MLAALLMSVAPVLYIALRSPSPAAAAALPRTGTAATNLADCVNSVGRLDVLFLIDESGSLGGPDGTDPTAQRVQGIKAALSGLADLASSAGGGAPAVRVLLSGFAGHFNTAPSFRSGVVDPFQALTPATLPALFGEADRFAALNRGAWTDYSLAFLNAKQVLADQAALETARGGPAPCQALVFFTDGMYSIPGGPAAVAAGKNLLCQPGGFTDQLRADGVETFTLGLETQMQPADSAFLGAVTDGAAPGCGTTASAATGLYLPVQDSSDLFLLFGNLFTPGAPPIRSSPLDCSSEPCATPSGSFRAAPGITTFVLRASMPNPQVSLVLHPPSGSPVVIKPSASGTFRAAGASLAASWFSGGDLEVTGTFPGNSSTWVGRWAFDFVGAAGAGGTGTVRYTLHLQADVIPALLGSPAFTLGVPERLAFQLTDASGNAVTSGPLAGAVITAGVADPSNGRDSILTVSDQGAGRYASSYTAPLTSTAGNFTLSVTAAFPPLAGVTVSTQTRTYDIRRQFPAFYPRISPLSLALPSVTGTHPTSGVLTVLGDRRVAGCVWFSTTTGTVPAAARPVQATLQPSATAPSSCIRVPAGGTEKVTVTFTNRHSADGAVRGAVLAHLTSTANPGVQLLNIPVSYSLRTPKDVPKELAIVVGLLLAGIVISLLALHAVNVFTGRFTAPELLLANGFDVTVVPDDGVYLNDGGKKTPFTVPEHLNVLRNRRRPHRESKLEIDGLHFETVATAQTRNRLFRLFKGPIGLVRAPGTRLVGATAAGAARRLSSGDMVVPLGLGGTWIFRPAPSSEVGADRLGQSGARVAGRLTLVVGALNAGRQREALQRSIDAVLPEAVEDLVPPPAEPTVSYPVGAAGSFDIGDTGDGIPVTPSSDEGHSAGHDI